MTEWNPIDQYGATGNPDTVARASAAQAISGQMLKNFSPPNLYKFRTAIGRAATGGAFVKVLCCGDSITSGAVADPLNAMYKMKSWTTLLCTYLTNAGIPAISSSSFGASGGSVMFGNPPGFWDGRLTGSGGFATVPGSVSSFGGGCFISTVAGSLNFAPMDLSTLKAVTATNATPCVFTWPGTPPANGQPVVLGGTAVPTGFTAFVPYYVVGLSGSTFNLAATVGGAAIASTSTGTAVTACLLSSTDTCEIWTYEATAGVQGTSVDAGANITTITNLGSGFNIKKTVITYTAGAHVINVNWVSGNNTILGFDSYLSTAAPQIHMINGGVGGAASIDYNNDVLPIIRLGAIEFMAPDLCFLMIGTNDCIPSGNISVATYTAAIQTFIKGVQTAGGDVILLTFPPGAAVSSPLAIQAQYVNAMSGLSASNNIPIIDVNSNLVSKIQMTANGMGADPNHPNNIGTQVIARDVAAALLSFMGS